MTKFIRLNNIEASFFYYKIYTETGADIIFFPNYEHYYHYGTIFSILTNGECILNLCVYGKPKIEGINMMASIAEFFYNKGTKEGFKFVMFGSHYQDNKYIYIAKHYCGGHYVDMDNKSQYWINLTEACKVIEKDRIKNRLLFTTTTIDNFKVMQEHAGI